MIHITIVGCESGDWEGVYCNGELIEQTHRVPLWMFLRELAGRGLLSYEHVTLTDEAMEEIGHLPDKLSDKTW